MTKQTLRFETETHLASRQRAERARCLLRAPEACRRQALALEQEAARQVSDDDVARVLRAWPAK